MIPDMKRAPLLHLFLHSTLPFVVAAIFIVLSCFGKEHAGHNTGNAPFEVWPSFDHTSYGWPMTAVRIFKVNNDLTIPGRFDFVGILFDLVALLAVTGTLHFMLYLISRPAKQT